MEAIGTLFLKVNMAEVIALLGTFAFAVSGIRMAAGHDIDWVGAYLIGLVTAIGGGTVRDLLLGLPPFWMEDASYFITTGVALLAMLLLQERLIRMGRTLFLFDTIGLGLFTITGVIKTLEAGYPFWVAVIMGAITGSVGGVIRDVLINQVPLVFRKDLYATACLAGGLVFLLCQQSERLLPFAELIGASSIIVVRLVAVRYRIHFPILKGKDLPGRPGRG